MRRLLPALTVVMLGTCACASSVAGTGSGSGGPASTPATRVSSSTARTSPPPPVVTPTSVRSTSGGASTPAAPSSGPAHPVPTTPLRTVSVVAPADGKTYVVKVWAQETTHDCTHVSYGAPVISFLETHPCAALTRLLATTRVNGRDVGFAQSSIGFSGTSAQEVYRTAGKFRALVTRDGTGNIDDLFRAGYGLPSGPQSVPSPDAFLAQAQDNTVTIDDSWYLSGSTPENDPPLVQMARDIYLQF